MLTIVSCGRATTECTDHTDANGDGICDTEGCGKTVESSPPTTDVFNDDGELILYKSGVPTFRFVRGTDIGVNAKELDELVEILTDLSDGEVKAVAATEPQRDVEILIGNVTNSTSVDKYSYGMTSVMHFMRMRASGLNLQTRSRILGRLNSSLPKMTVRDPATKYLLMIAVTWFLSVSLATSLKKPQPSLILMKY